MGYDVFYLKDKANLWRVIVRERQHEPGFDWRGFKELIEDHFYVVSPQKINENEFM